MRDRLIELLRNALKKEVIFFGENCGTTYQTAEDIADYLLANGVIVPPCKVGDTVYCAKKSTQKIMTGEIEDITYWDTGHFSYGIDCGFYSIGARYDEVFLTREEAERALKGGEG